MSTFLALLMACQPPASDYTLRIIPVLLESQRDDVLALEPDIFVQLTWPDGTDALHYAGVASEGKALQLEALPPLPAGTVVALIAVHPGGPQDEWERESTIAYGEATVSQDLATGKVDTTLEIRMPRVDEPARLGSLKGADRRLGGAMAALPGAIYLFGGGDPETPDRLESLNLGDPRFISSDTVLKATRTEEGWSEFEEVGKIPPYFAYLGFDAGPYDVQTVYADRRSGMTATVVNTQGKTAILVVGGRPTEFPAYYSETWFLWDPETDTVLDATEPVLDEYGQPVVTLEGRPLLIEPTIVARSDHLAFPLGANKVLVYGGMQKSNDGLPRYEIWSGQSRSSDIGDENQDLVDPEGGTNAVGGVLGFGTRLSSDVILCGGFIVNFNKSDVHEMLPQRGCRRFAPNGRVTSLAPLPTELGAAAIAPLPDGGLLVTGGTDQPLVEDVSQGAIIIGSASPNPAVGKAYRWDPSTNEWSTLEDELVYPRAHHKMVLLSTGKVLVIGGTEKANLLLGDIGAPVDCAELFDPETNTFTANVCSSVGQGAYPEVVDEGSEIVLFEGMSGKLNSWVGGSNYGSVSELPD